MNNDRQELRFTGVHLGFASTEHRGSDRWVEFSIYRTESGKYILSRIGRSVRYHDKICRTVAKNPQLRPVPVATLTEDMSPCDECLPNGDDHLADNDQIYPEMDRPAASVYESVDDLMDGLMLINEHGLPFLTHVAQDVLAAASENDAAIHQAYYVVEVS